MKQYLCTRYPVDKKHGGVSRAWLIEQRHTAKYPNLLLEIALHPAPPALTAVRIGVSEDVLVDILLGKDQISWGEAKELRDALRTDVGYPCYEFAFSSSLDCDNTCEDGDGLKEARRDARKLKGKHPAIPLIKALVKGENPPRAAVMAIDFYSDYQRPEYARKVMITPRTLPLQAWEDYSAAIEGLDAEMIDRLDEYAHEKLLQEYREKHNKP